MADVNSEPEPDEAPAWRRLLHRVWPKIHTGTKAVTGLAGLGAAMVAIYAWFPQALDSVRPELKEYALLKSLYAGASVSLFDSKLGPPSSIKAVPGEPGVTERLYVKDAYLVETLATAEGQTKLFSVLSCRADFKPTFDFFGSKVTLQDKPMAELKPFDRQPEELHALVPETVSSPTFYFEMIAEVSGASHNRGSGYGVNAVCSGHGSANGLPAFDYSGPPEKAPQDLADYRARTPANFYVETWDRSIRGPGNYPFDDFFLVTPFHEDVPPGWPHS